MYEEEIMEQSPYIILSKSYSFNKEIFKTLARKLGDRLGLKKFDPKDNGSEIVQVVLSMKRISILKAHKEDGHSKDHDVTNALRYLSHKQNKLLSRINDVIKKKHIYNGLYISRKHLEALNSVLQEIENGNFTIDDLQDSDSRGFSAQETALYFLKSLIHNLNKHLGLIRKTKKIHYNNK